ncbi:MAG: hypothetical protein U0931_15775 [Vulcanimicrobiota bacterium]
MKPLMLTALMAMPFAGMAHAQNWRDMHKELRDDRRDYRRAVRDGDWQEARQKAKEIRQDQYHLRRNGSNNNWNNYSNGWNNNYYLRTNPYNNGYYYRYNRYRTYP